MFQHEQEGNDAVIGVKIFPKVIMRAHLARKESVLTSHPVFHERVTTLRDDWCGAFSFAYRESGPDDSRIENDPVITAVLCQKDVCEQRGDVRAGNEFAFFGKKHAAVG